MNGSGILILIVLGILVVVFWYLERRVGPHRGDMTIEQSTIRACSRQVCVDQGVGV